ncbi:Cysteine protease atg4, partial [Coemansia erecta]
MVLTNDESIPAPNEPNKSNEPNELSDSTNAPSTADLFVNTLRDWYVLASDSLASLLDGRFLQQPARDLWLLGKHYPLDGPEYPATVTDDFARLIWCTYRSNYAPIAQSQYTTDAGWGCMLRAGQTLMAQALLLHRLGRDWAFSWAEDIRSRRLYTRTVEEFLDDYSPRCT